MSTKKVNEYNLPSFSSIEELRTLLDDGLKDIDEGNVCTLDEVMGNIKAYRENFDQNSIL